MALPESEGAAPAAEAESEGFVNETPKEETEVKTVVETKDPKGLGTEEEPTDQSVEEKHDDKSQEEEDFPKWQAQTKGDNKKNPALKDIKTIDELANKYLDLKGKVEAPEKIEDYVIDDEFFDKLPLMDGLVDKLKENAFKKGVPVAAFKYAVDSYKDILNIQAAQMKEQMAAEKEKATTKYQKEWGDDYTKNLILMNKGIEAFGGDEFRTILNSKGLGNDPRVIDFLVEKGKSIASKKNLEGDTSEVKKNPGYITYKTMEGM